MTRHFPDLGSASDRLNQVSHAARPIRSTTHIWVVTRNQYGIAALVSETSFGGETSGSVAKCTCSLFSQAKTIRAGVSALASSWLGLRGHFYFSNYSKRSIKLTRLGR